MIDITEGLLGLGVVAGAALTFWQSHQAKHEARQAATNAHPVSNGWGSKVATDLDYLRNGMDGLHRRMSEADARDNQQDSRLTTIEQQSRTAAEQSSAVATGLSAHLADHASADAREVRT